MAPAPSPRLPCPCRPLFALFLCPHAPRWLLTDEGPLRPPSPAAERQPGPGASRAAAGGDGAAAVTWRGSRRWAAAPPPPARRRGSRSWSSPPCRAAGRPRDGRLSVSRAAGARRGGKRPCWPGVPRGEGGLRRGGGRGRARRRGAAAKRAAAAARAPSPQAAVLAARERGGGAMRPLPLGRLREGKGAVPGPPRHARASLSAARARGSSALRPRGGRRAASGGVGSCGCRTGRDLPFRPLEKRGKAAAAGFPPRGTAALPPSREPVSLWDPPGSHLLTCVGLSLLEALLRSPPVLGRLPLMKKQPCF